MTSVVLYFQVHQPWRLAPFTAFDVGGPRRRFDDATNRRIVRRVADRCYRPANAVLAALVKRHGDRFRFAFSLSGTVLDQMERWARPALRSFRDLARTGQVEVLAETSHHSLAFLESPAELERQVRLHADRVEALFGRRPTAFRNTELMVDDGVARSAERMGFSCVLAEGADRLLRGRSPHRVWRAAGCRRVRYLLRSYRLSDDVAFRFGSGGASPLSPATFAGWLRAVPAADVIGLFMDYETFGEHHPASTGILGFLDAFPAEALRVPGLDFATPTEASAAHEPAGTLRIRRPISWADTERDLSAWLGNDMQRSAHAALYAIRPAVLRASRRSPDLGETWRRLTTSDHLYYMCTKWFSDGDVHKYFSPWASPHDAFLAYMNVVEDLRRRTAPGRGRPVPRGVARSRRPSPARAE